MCVRNCIDGLLIPGWRWDLVELSICTSSCGYLYVCIMQFNRKFVCLRYIFLIVVLVVIVILPESVSVSLESEMLSSGCAWSLAWLVSRSNDTFTPPPSHHGTLSLNAEACKTRQTSSHTHRHPEAFDTFCMDFCSVVLDKEMGGWLLKKSP